MSNLSKAMFAIVAGFELMVGIGSLVPGAAGLGIGSALTFSLLVLITWEKKNDG